MSASPDSPYASSTLQEAIEQARPFFQPIVSLRHHGIVGYEALARGPMGTPWESPATLFAEAEAQGLLPHLEARIWEAALTAWETRFPRLLLCLNAHPGTWSQLQPPDGAGCPPPRLKLIARLRQGGQLVVEVPERLTLAQWDLVQRQADELRNAGIQLWLDDLGSAAAGLQLLASLRPDGIKLDRLLVAGVDSDPYRQAVVRALVGAARDLGLALVAEGVETQAELACLAALGVDLFQGFLLGRPADEPQPLAPDVLDLLARVPAPDPSSVATAGRPLRLRGRRKVAWVTLEALSRTLSQARSLREALGHVGRALADQLASDGVLLVGDRSGAREPSPQPPIALPGGLSVVVLDGVLWPPVPGLEPTAQVKGRLSAPGPSDLRAVRFYPNLHLPDAVWEPVGSLSVRLGFSSLLTIPVPAGGAWWLVWAVGWRKPAWLRPEAFSLATVLADYTALQWRRWTCGPPAPMTTGASASESEA